ncbi:hypothetical protein F5B21DRAFT_525939 [Xylaria acuta]|nr:hypothetical protein F5B21DRAFT_525939 [Xylaria acuta]
MVEKAMDEWAIVIVPDLPNDPTTNEVEAWITSAPRDNDTRLGRDLDQPRLVFRGTFRPRARFLWLWLACAILKRFWSSPIHGAPEKLTSQFGRGIWETGGPYIRRDFVLGMVEEVGREIGNFLLEGAMLISWERTRCLRRVW